jgi:tetratricopeptide (TPR) repeat protein
LIDSGSRKQELSKAYSIKGGAFVQMSADDRALADYNEAIRLEPERAFNYVSRAGVWKRMKEFDRAIADCTEAIRLDPKDYSAFQTRADIWKAKKEIDRAIADYGEAIRLKPGDSFLLTARGDAWKEKHELDRAIDDYSEAIRVDPKTPLALANRGLAWIDKGDLDRAMSDFDSAVRIAPGFPALYQERSEVWYRKGDLDRALSECDQGIRLLHNDVLLSFAHRFCAQQRFFKGDYPAAAEELERSIKLKAGGDSVLWLFLTRGRAGKDGAAELAANAGKLEAKDWPYPLMEFYLGREPAEAMLTTATTPEEDCDAEFYLGEWRLLHGDRAGAKTALQTAADTCPPSRFLVVPAVAAELKRLDP